MTRKEDYFSLGGFSDKYPSNEDLELWIKYLLESKTLAIIPKTLVNYRRSRGQGSLTGRVDWISRFSTELSMR